MAKKKPRRKSTIRVGADVNELAASIVTMVAQTAEDHPEKNPAAVSLGRIGGLKGGKARAAALSARKRSAIAKKAAKARWKSKPKAGES